MMYPCVCLFAGEIERACIYVYSKCLCVFVCMSVITDECACVFGSIIKINLKLDWMYLV